MRSFLALVREASASARSQPVASLLTIMMVGGMCVAVLMTSGRTVAAEDAVLAQIDAAGTRSVVVRAGEGAGVTTDVLQRIHAIEDVESVAGFGPITDAHNVAVPGAPPVAVRTMYQTYRSGVEGGTRPSESIGLDRRESGGDQGAMAPGMRVAVPGSALASGRGAAALGLIDGTGEIVTSGGSHVTVVGSIEPPEYLAFLEPFVVIPEPVRSVGRGRTLIGDEAGAEREGNPAPLALVVVLVDEPHMVAAVADALAGLLGAVDQQQITIETAEQLVGIRAAIGGELGSYGRETVLGILAITTVLVAVNLLGMVQMRRKDFGRRRALGASQGLIVALLTCQVGVLAIIGATLGTGMTLVALATTSSPTPDLDYSLAVAVAAVLSAVLAALVPALIAARREPLRELRIP